MMTPARFSNSTVIFAALLSLLILVLLLPHSPAPGYVPGLSSLSISSTSRPIPSIVHYVYLKKDEQSILHFTFQDFLSVYASILYFNPTSILIHTDHNASYLEEAATKGNLWTRKILTSFPNIVKANIVEAPTHAGNGKEIWRIEHKSDFVRIEQVHATGGIYLDWDVLPLRPLQPLLESGFESVVGRQPGGKVNNGAFMAQKGSSFTGLMNKEGNKVFDGGWETHSIKLALAVSERLMKTPKKVLIMEERAFSPTSWRAPSPEQLFAPHNETPVPVTPLRNDDFNNDPELVWEAEKSEKREWELDFSPSYLLHAYKQRGDPIPGFEAVTLPYVLKRESNYALAAWPVVQHALDNGIVEEVDVEP
jgi:hypothetical protein